MDIKHLRRLLYSSGAIAAAGVLLSVFALDGINTSMAQADAALEWGSTTVSTQGGAGLAPDGTPALVVLERANVDSSQGTLVLGLAGTLAPLLIFLNVLGFVGQYAPAPTDSKLQRGAPVREGDPAPLKLECAE